MGDTWSDLVTFFTEFVLLYGAVGFIAVVLAGAPYPFLKDDSNKCVSS